MLQCDLNDHKHYSNNLLVLCRILEQCYFVEMQLQVQYNVVAKDCSSLMLLINIYRRHSIENIVVDI